MCHPAPAPGPGPGAGPGDVEGTPDDRSAAFHALLEDSPEDLYEHAPCGYLSTLLDGEIAKVNATLLDWLGYEREELVGRRRFSDLLTVGGRLYHETHFAPLLRMQGELAGIALELKTASGGRLPVLVTSVIKKGPDGQPLLVRTTIADARDRRAYERELLRARQEAEEARAEAERQRAEAERQAAAAELDRQRLQQVVATLQSSLLPPSLPAVPGLEAAAHYRTASPDRLGGDFYDLYPLGDGRWGFFLGDVCGKGPRAAALTSLTRYTLRAAALHDPDPMAALKTLNAVLHEQYTGEDPRYCTVVSGTLTPHPDGSFAVAIAGGGHPPPLVLRADGTAAYLPTPGGVLVGVLPQATFVPAGTTLRPGDTLLLYTDGLTEARLGGAARGGDRYGDEALQDFASGLAPATAEGTIAALRGLLDDFGAGLDDDTALLALGVPAPAAAPVRRPAGTVHPAGTDGPIHPADTEDPTHPAGTEGPTGPAATEGPERRERTDPADPADRRSDR